MVIKFTPPKHLRIFSYDRGYITEHNDGYCCSYLDILHFSRKKDFALLSDAIAFMEGLGYMKTL